MSLPTSNAFLVTPVTEQSGLAAVSALFRIESPLMDVTFAIVAPNLTALQQAVQSLVCDRGDDSPPLALSIAKPESVQRITISKRS